MCSLFVYQSCNCHMEPTIYPQEKCSKKVKLSYTQNVIVFTMLFPGSNPTPSLATSAWKAWNRREQQQWATPPTGDSLPLAIDNSMLRVQTCKKPSCCEPTRTIRHVR